MVIFIPLLNVLLDLLHIYKWALFIFIVLNWLEAFNILNNYNSFVYGVRNFLQSVIDPVLNHIRKILPPISGWDLSPIALVLIIHFLQGVLHQILIKVS